MRVRPRPHLSYKIQAYLMSTLRQVACSNSLGPPSRTASATGIAPARPEAPSIFSPVRKNAGFLHALPK